MNPLQIWVVSFENSTTRTELKPAPRTEELPAGFVCFIDQASPERTDVGMILDLPPRTCARGHKVKLQLDVGMGEKLLHFPVIAEVLEVSSQQKAQRDAVTFQLVGFEETDWAWIQGAYRARQDAVSALFEKLRGL
jgi:hypothetical protein